MGTNTMEANEFAARRYLASENSGDAIDSGIYLFVIGLVVALLVRIARNQQRN